MADNYIERKMEELEARKAMPKKPVSNRAGHKRRVFVTGGASGIGKAIVKAFSNEGYRVAFCDRDAEQGKETSKETGALFFPADVSDKEALESCLQQLFDRWGDVDVLINNAGISEFSPLTETTVEEFDRILSINLRPVFVASRYLALHRKQQTFPNPYGRIINLCSTRYLMSEPGTEGYSASKGGIYSLTHALAVSLEEWHITVNSIAPGWIATHDYDGLTSQDHLQHPSGRVGRPEDIARMCVFLCQDGNDFINGENIVIDGGMTKKMIYVE